MHERNSAVISDLVSKLKGLDTDHFEYLEVKQLAEILARHRAKARAAVGEYRRLMRAVAAEQDPIEKLYLGYEAMFSRDHLRDTLRLYVIINRDFHEAYRSYMDGLLADNAASDTSVFSFMPTHAANVTKMSQRRRKAA